MLFKKKPDASSKPSTPQNKKAARRAEKQAAKDTVRAEVSARAAEKQKENAPEPGARVRNYAMIAALLVILCVGLYTAFGISAEAPTFNGKVDVATLQNDPTAYSLDEADGAAYVIVAENLDKTEAQNVCFSVVFNFRGYDTMGESFILIAALSGSLCILRTIHHPKKNKQPAEKEVGVNG